MTSVPLTQFTVQQFAEAAVDHDSGVSGADVDVEPIAALLTFTPSQSEFVITSGATPVVVRLQPIHGRLDTDGILRTINHNPVYYLDGSTRNACPDNATPVFGDQADPMYWVQPDGTHVDNPTGTPIYGVRLVANDASLGITGLSYKVVYTTAVYDDRSGMPVNGFTFAAPDSDVPVDLSAVTRTDVIIST